MKAERAIIVYGMGITEHRRDAQNVQQLANLVLLRGHIGREGAGLCPVRGHSNMQGDRTVGITETPSEEFLDRLEHRFGFKAPRTHGHNVVTALEAMIRGEVSSPWAATSQLPFPTGRQHRRRCEISRAPPISRRS